MFPFSIPWERLCQRKSLGTVGLYAEVGGYRLTAGTALQNEPSVTFLKALGFSLTETEKVSFYKDEHGEDVVFDGGIFALLL